jgi:hypothetical protein
MLSHEPEDWENLKRITEAGDIRAIKELAGHTRKTAQWANGKEPIEVFEGHVTCDEQQVEGLVHVQSH